MPGILRRTLAPITKEAWDELDRTVTTVVKSQLTGRTLVDFDGPHGLGLACVNSGEMQIPKNQGSAEAPWGVRKVLPLVEVRIPATLKQMEIDSISRGSKTPDLAPLEEAARKLARFEERAIYRGFPEGGIAGMIESAAHDPITLPAKPEHLAGCVADGVKELSLAGLGGPFVLVLGAGLYHTLTQSAVGNCPAQHLVHAALLRNGHILRSPVLEGGVLLTARGGDFELTVGQDIAIGYARHDTDEVELYLTESLQFRVLQPEAVIELRGKQ